MRERPRATVSELRTAISCLPRATRVAMLQGLEANEIVVGAYTHDGGICPMLAAHRAGGRTSFIGFAKAWDRFAFRGARRGRARRASERELLILRSHLEASLLEDDGPASELRKAIAEYREMRQHREHEEQRQLSERQERRRQRERDARRELRQRRRREGPRPGDPDRSRELGTRPGWGWMRIVRRFDDYERALALLQEQEEALVNGQTTVVPTPH